MLFGHPATFVAHRYPRKKVHVRPRIAGARTTLTFSPADLQCDVEQGVKERRPRLFVEPYSPSTVGFLALDFEQYRPTEPAKARALPCRYHLLLLFLLN